VSIELNIHLKDLDTGKVHQLTHWTSYNIISDLKNPAPTFTASLAAVESQRAFTAHGGQLAQVFSYGALQMTALTDERSEACNIDATDLQISGRGVGGLLLDSVVDSRAFSMTNLTLLQVAGRITEPWRPTFIPSIVTNNAANRYVVAGSNPAYATKSKITKFPIYNFATGKLENYYEEKADDTKVQIKGTKKKFGRSSPVYRGIDSTSLKQTRIQPDEKVWDVIDRLSKQIAAMPFVGADGTLIITRPCYDFDSSVYGTGIVQKWDKKTGRALGGNVMRSQFETSIATRNSELVAWATGKPKKTAMGKELLKHTWSVKDPSPAFWIRQSTPPYVTTNILPKPDRVVFKNIRNEKLIRRRCRGIFEEKVIDAFSLEYQIPGHTINGVMPVIDSMIDVHDERYGLIGTPYYITRVERRFDISDGRTTVLRLIPPKIWLHFDHDATSDSQYLEHMVQRVFW
jgi:prophage tail gpP-like protein